MDFYNTKNTIINNLIDTYLSIISGIYICYKKIKIDEFTDTIIENESEQLSEYINGCFSFVSFPRGNVIFHKDNTWKMDNLHRFFMMHKNIIPNIYHNCPKQFIINRTDGSECFVKLLNNDGFILSEKDNDFIVRVHFKKDKSKYDMDMISPCINNTILETDFELEKQIPLKIIMTKNNIKYITFTFKLYSLHFIETMNNNNNNKKNVYIYFNEKIIEWVDTILMPFIKKNNLNIIINYINIE
jgi:hypothetical protein|tara:strand:+ start:62 stop:790 length:729 start_codon:yes stop_codon:yes gene_type:complete